jgi:acetyltransferase-like isoleucine patch superfamily enzyme
MEQRAQPAQGETAATAQEQEQEQERQQERGLIQTLREGFLRRRALPLRQIALKAARYAAARLTAPIYLRGCDRVGERARTTGGEPVVDNRGRIEIGDDLHVHGAFTKVRFTTGPRGIIRLGDDVFINIGCSIAAEDSVVVGDHVSFGPHVVVQDHDDAAGQGEKPEPIFIGDHVWLASRVRVMAGARIGAGTVVMAGSVVVGALPPGVVAGGVPARVLRPRARVQAAPREVVHG